MKSLLKFPLVLFLASLQFVSCKKDDYPVVKAQTALKADAGPDQTITLPLNSVILDGSHSSSPKGAIISYEWSKTFATAPGQIVEEKAAKTQVKDLTNGTYKFVLTVKNEAGNVARDTVQITVQPKLVSARCDNSNRPIVNARLLPVGTLSEARVAMAVAAAGNKIVFAGAALSVAGVNGYGSARVDIYDIEANTWSTAQLSETRSDIAAVAAGNKIFFAGGRLGDGAFDMLFSTVDIYDVVTNTWSVASLSEPRAYVAAATVGNKVFFAGGEKNWNYHASNRVDIYDLSTGKWSTASLRAPRSHISAVAVNNKVYFAGGQTENISLSAIDIFDNSTGTWSTASLSEAIGFPSGIALADNIYWMGGCKMETKNVNTWKSTIDYLSKPVGWAYELKIAVKDNKLVYFRNGGLDANTFDIYDLGTKTWSIGVLPQSDIQSQTIISVNNTIYLAGGSVNGNANNLSNQVWKLEF